MSDLISREALLKYPIRIDNYDKEHGNEHFVLGIESVIEFAESLAAVDAVEVVRCKDCKHQWGCTWTCSDNGFCFNGTRAKESEEFRCTKEIPICKLYDNGKCIQPDGDCNYAKESEGE